MIAVVMLRNEGKKDWVIEENERVAKILDLSKRKFGGSASLVKFLLLLVSFILSYTFWLL